MVQIFSITTFNEFLDFQSKFKNVILRFGASWCISCAKFKQEINPWITKLNLTNTVLLDIDFESYELDSDFVELITISKLPTLYCKDKFTISGTDLETIKTSILLLEPINEDF